MPTDSNQWRLHDAFPPASPLRRPGWQRFAPYVPLLAAAVEIPWIILVAMSHMGGLGNYTNDPTYTPRIDVECVVPATIGFFLGLLILACQWVKRKVEWVFFLIGLAICGYATVNFFSSIFEWRAASTFVSP